MAVVVCIVAVVGIIVGLATRGSGDPLVCLDAGHGGSDSGAVSEDGRQEKDDNLRLTLAVGKILEDNGVKVIYTRSEDEFVSLEERSDLANKHRSTVFVAIHRNSAESKASGIEAWIEKSSPIKDKKLAAKIINEVDRIGLGKNRGVHAGYQGNRNANYAVNAATKCPSCLLEMGFISTPEDNELFDKNFDEYANAIAKGIMDFI